MPECKSYEEMAEFWDTHSLAEYWDQTEPAEFDISEQARHRYVIRIDQKPCRQEQHVAPRGDGITPDVQGNEM
jgi:hypothetical protein